MDPKSSKSQKSRRSSILKRIDTLNTPASPVQTRRISFHGKKSVKEFYVGTDKATIWQDSYEEEAAHFSNEPLPSASSVFQKTVNDQATSSSSKPPVHIPIANATNATTLYDCQSSDGHMSVTCPNDYVLNGNTKSNSQQTILCDGENALISETFVVDDDVIRFNRSIEQLSVRDVSIECDVDSVNLNHTKYETCPMSDNTVLDIQNEDTSTIEISANNSDTFDNKGNYITHNTGPIKMRNKCTSVLQKVLSRRHRYTMHHLSNMDKTDVAHVQHESFRAASPACSDMDMSKCIDIGLDSYKKHTASTSAPQNLTTRRCSTMNITQCTPSSSNCNNFFIDESMVMPRDVFSSTKIVTLAGEIDDSNMDLSNGVVAVSNEAVVSSAHLLASTSQRPRDSVIRFNEAHKMSKMSTAVDVNRFDRTVQAVGDEVLANISDVSMPMTAESVPSGPQRIEPAERSIRGAVAADASSSLRLYRSDTEQSFADNTTELCNLNAEELCGVDVERLQLHNSGHTELGMQMSSNSGPQLLTVSNPKSTRPNIDRQILDEYQIEIDGPHLQRPCISNALTQQQNPVTKCEQCANCQRPAPYARQQPSPSSPLGSMSALLDRNQLGLTSKLDDEAAKSLEIDYGDYHRLSQYASYVEVFEMYRQRMERLRAKYDKLRFEISSNVPTKNYMFLIQNLLSKEFADQDNNTTGYYTCSKRIVLPAKRSVEFLLRNAFDTAGSESPWVYCGSMFHRGRISCWNKRVPSILLHFEFDVPASIDADLRFKIIKVSCCHKMEQIMHPIQWVTHSELLFHFPFQLIGLCPSSTQLMTFLQSLDEKHYQPAIKTEKHLDKLISNTHASVEREADGTCYIERYIFDRERRKRIVVTIKLTVVEQTAMKHVFIRPPLENTLNTKFDNIGAGLPIIERLLCEPIFHTI